MTPVRWKIFLLCMMLGLANGPLHAQFFDTDAVVSESLESRYQDNEGVNWEEHIEEIQDRLESPIELNTATRQELEQLPFLSDIQIEHILAYIYRHEGIASYGELLLIDDIDVNTERLLRVFTTVDISKRAEKTRFPSARNIFRHGRHELQGRVDIPFYKRKGYLTGKYLGRPFYQSMRYRFHYGDYLQFGVTAEKDAGEPFFALHDKKGYDYYSPYLMLQRWGRLRTLAVGNYRLCYGQGLVLGQGFYLGKGYDLDMMEMRSSGIRKHSSTDEYNYFQGVAAAVSLTDALTLSAFYSNRSMSGTVKSDTITSIYKSGLYRTESEAGKRGAFRMQAYGGNLTYDHNHLKLGLTAIRYTMNRYYSPTLKGYAKYNLHGAEFFNAGMDYKLRYGKFSVQGEGAVGTKGFALLNHVHYRLSHRYHFMLLHRFYRYDYWALFAQTFSDGSSVQNENGWYVAADMNPFAHWRFFLGVDFVSYPWWKYRISRPSQSWDITSQVSYTPLPHCTMLLNYRYKCRDRDVSGTSGQEIQPTYYHRLRYRMTNDWGVVRLQTTFDYNNFRQLGFEAGQGYRVSEQVSLAPRRWPVSLVLQGSYFHTDNYDSRVYIYEKSLLNTLSVSSFQGRGFRASVFVRVDLGSHYVVIARYGHTFYQDRDEIGSGNDLIEQSEKADLQLQFRIKY